MRPVLHEVLKAFLVLVGVMSNHRRPTAGCAVRRSTARYHTAMAMVVTLAMLATACGSARSDDSAGSAPPVSQQSDDRVPETDVPETIGVLGPTETPEDDDSVPDYTEAELEVLLDTPGTDEVQLDPPEPAPLEAESPMAAIEAIEAELGESPDGGATPILDEVEPLDTPTGAVFGIRDGRRINEAGEAILLDEAAALACANVEIALTALDENRSAEAADGVRAASVATAETAVPAIKTWTSILEQAAAEVATGDTANGAEPALLAFLATCTEGGYEL